MISRNVRLRRHKLKIGTASEAIAQFQKMSFCTGIRRFPENVILYWNQAISGKCHFVLESGDFRKMSFCTGIRRFPENVILYWNQAISRKCHFVPESAIYYLQNSGIIYPVYSLSDGFWQSFISIEVCRDRKPALASSCKKRLTGFFVCLLFFLKVKHIT